MKEDKKLLKRVTKAVDKRLSGKRLEHVHSVSECAAKLARIYGANEFDARIAGLLHDWDKLLTDDELPARLDELGIERPANIEYLYPVLHSFTALPPSNASSPSSAMISSAPFTSIRWVISK